jgi:hypothetical protein
LTDLVDVCNDERLATDPAAPSLEVAVTEINLEYEAMSPLDPTLTAQSVLAGQFWANVMNVGMKKRLDFVAFWSIKEGGPPPLGYITTDGANGFKLLSPYYHYQMIAEHFHGVYAAAIVNNPYTATVKAFGAEDSNQIVVMLLNQNQAAPLNYTVRLGNAAFVGGGLPPLLVNIDAGLNNKLYSGAIAGESTVILLFTANGTFRRGYQYGASDEASGTGPRGYP